MPFAAAGPRQRLLRTFMGLVTAAVTGSNANGASSGETLQSLVRTGAIDNVQAYLSRPGVDINDRSDMDRSLLDYAAEQNQVAVATFLLDHGARIEAAATSYRDMAKGITALHRAAYFDAADVVTLLLSRGAAVDAHTPNGATPLAYAASNGSLRAARLLISGGADIAARFSQAQTPLSEAIVHGHMAVVRLLTEHGAVPDPQSLPGAAAQGQFEAVQFMLRQHVDMAAKNAALRFAIMESKDRFDDRVKIIDALLADGADIDNDEKKTGAPLTLADTPEMLEVLFARGANQKAKVPGADLGRGFACNRQLMYPVPIFDVLLAHGVDFAQAPSKGESPLFCAVLLDRRDLAEFLLEHGASPNLSGTQYLAPLFQARDLPMTQLLLDHGANIDALDANRRTPLLAAVTEGRVDKAVYLLARRADFRIDVSPNEPPLHAAARSGEQPVVLALLERGADVNSRNRWGDTALHVAIASDHESIVAALIDQGADVDARGRDGWSPLHTATSRNSLAAAALLLGKHADVSARDDELLMPLNRAASKDLRALLVARIRTPDPETITASDMGACREVVRQVQTGVSMHAGLEAELRVAPRSPEDDWNELDEKATPQRLDVRGKIYVLGLDSQRVPVYLARVGADGVKYVLCEFTRDGSDAKSPVFRVLTEYERLSASSRRDRLSISLESLKRHGLRGAQAVLEASRRAVDPVQLGLASDRNLLGDAIEAHRDDVLAYYLSQGVDPDLKWLLHSPLDYSANTPWHDSPVFTAAHSGTPESLRLLLDHGANPDSTGDIQNKSVLTWAVHQGAEATVATLLGHGANPDIPTSSMFGSLQAISDGSPLAGADAAAIRALIQHGADPEPWIFQAFQIVARAKDRSDLLRSALNGTAVKAEWVDLALASPGHVDNRLESLLKEATTVRDSPTCPAEAMADQMQRCLPNSLKTIDVALDTREVALLNMPGGTDPAIKDSQRDWLKERNRRCRLRELSGITKAGWYSYVLADPAMAACVLNSSRERLRTLERLPR